MSQGSNRIAELKEKLKEEKSRQSALAEQSRRDSVRLEQNRRIEEQLRLREELEEKNREIERLKEEQIKREEMRIIAQQALQDHLEEERLELEARKLELENNYTEKNIELERLKREIDERVRLEQEMKQKLSTKYKLDMKVSKLEKEHNLKLPIDTEERKLAYESIKAFIKKQQMQKNFRKCLIFTTVVIELLFAGIIGLGVDGFVEDQIEQLEEYDDIFEEIIDEYFSGSGPKMDPLKRLGLLLGFNFVLMLVGNLLTKLDPSGLSGMVVTTGKKEFGNLIKGLFIGIDKGKPDMELMESTILGSYKVAKELPIFKNSGPTAPKQEQSKRGPVYTG